MASKQNQVVIQCSGCQKELDLDSKTLPCLHSFCRYCLDEHFKGETSGNGQNCPECHEPLTIDQLSLSPFLVRSLRRRRLETIDWKCDLCPGDGIGSTPQSCCHVCQILFCDKCSNFHKKFHPKHESRNLNAIERCEVIELMVKDMCSLHQKERNLYCERCNVCLCDTCYQNHSADSPMCSSKPLSVREEALKQKSKGPTMANEMEDLELSLKCLDEKTRNYTEELKLECDTKCKQLWDNYMEMIENAKLKTNELMEDLRQLTDTQVKRWCHLLAENEKILKQLKIWRINLQHLLNESQQDVDVVCGLQLLGSKLSPLLHKPVVPEEKYQLDVTFLNWWFQILEELTSDTIGSVSLSRQEWSAHNLEFDNQWNLRGSNLNIYSIHVSREDSHIFFCDYHNTSIIECTEGGEFVYECQLFDGINKFAPIDICSISPDNFVVACGNENKLILLERKNITPFLQIKKIIQTNQKYVSLCKIKDNILACDCYFHIDSFTKEGEQIKILKTAESEDGCHTIIRSDPATGKFWGTKMFSSEILSFNADGKKLRSVKTEEKIFDFCVSEFGHLYFCNMEGILSYNTKDILYKFEKTSESVPILFVSRKKLFVCLRVDGKQLINIFKIPC